MQQAIFVMWFFVVCMLLLSGIFTPAYSMPSWAYLTTYVNPMHYFVDAIRTVFVRGGGFQSIAHQVLALLCIGGFMGIWAVLSYKKNSKWKIVKKKKKLKKFAHQCSLCIFVKNYDFLILRTNRESSKSSMFHSVEDGRCTIFRIRLTSLLCMQRGYIG